LREVGEKMRFPGAIVADQEYAAAGRVPEQNAELRDAGGSRP
jgi:hypothetical protein